MLGNRFSIVKFSWATKRDQTNNGLNKFRELQAPVAMQYLHHCYRLLTKMDTL